VANQALYLKWRPQGFDELIGQEHIVTTLRNSLKQERIRHAYLFSGPRGTGKTSTARLLAKAVNCTHPDVNLRPCNDCRNCTTMMEGRFFDLIEIDAASHTGVDDVRDLRDKIAFSPSEGQYKVYIIDEVHRFSGAAFDALLKTLEEPPAHAIFVLATTELDKVPATIKSRCLLFEFRRVSLRQVVERLQMICDDEGIMVEPAALELIARQGTGSVRDSISLLDQVVADPTQPVSLELAQRMLGAVGSGAVVAVIDAIVAGNTALALDALNDAIDGGADPRQFGQQMVDHLRQMMLVQVGGVHLVDASDEMRSILLAQAGEMGRGALLRAVRKFNEAVIELRGGWQPQLPLELAIVESTQPHEEAYAPPVAVATAPPPAPRSAPRETVAAAPTETEQESAATFDDIMRRWGAFLKTSEMQRTTLPAILEHAHPLRLVGNVLYLGVSNAVFKPKIEKHMETLINFVQTFFGERLQILIELAGDAHTPNAKQARKTDDLDNFGVDSFNAQVIDLE